jgi:MoaA/NifB/PqqE/SkfB family radical SAM enzyme
MAERGIKGNTNRIRLEEHIPLDTPLHVFLDASSVCNFRCSFCPHGNGEAAKVMPQTVMPVELAKKCIDDLTEFPNRIKRISFSAVGEPLVNQSLPEIVGYAKSKDVADCLNITTNASLLTHDMAERLTDAGLNHIDISVYGLNEAAYQQFSHKQLSFETLVRQVRDCHDLMKTGETVVKITDAVFHTKAERDKFYAIFSPICDKICVEHAVPFWYDLNSATEYDGKNIYGEPVCHKEVCPVPFFSLAIHANGIATSCCIDWKNKGVLGDARKESVLSIWNGLKHKNVCKALLKYGTKGISPCDHCRYHELVAMDNIDPYRTELLKRLEGEDAL